VTVHDGLMQAADRLVIPEPTSAVLLGLGLFDQAAQKRGIHETGRRV